MTSRVQGVCAAALLVLATLAVYAPALEAGFVWDDDDYVTANPLLHEPDGLRRIWLGQDVPSQYFPLTYTVLRVEYSLWGLEPFGYHLVNVLLHAANALLFAWALRRLTIPGSMLAAALFALHPVHVESVAWVTELKNVLSLHAFLWALHAWLSAVEQRGAKRAAFYVLSLTAHAAALFAKTTACTFPAAQVLVLWAGGRKLGPKGWLALTPFVGMGLAMGLLSVYWEVEHQGTVAEVFSASFVERGLIASRALWFYLGKLLWPHPLLFSYPKFPVDAGQWGHYVWAAAWVVSVAILLRWRRRSAAPLLALAWFVAMLSPLVGFIDLFTFRYAYVADHYVYVASLGPLALAAAAVSTAARREGLVLPRFVRAGAIAGLGALAMLSHQQAGTYENRETLWRHVLAHAPESWMARGNLVRELLRQERDAEALEVLDAAEGESPLAHVGQTNAGIALARLGRDDEARARFEAALEREPNYTAALDGLGRMHSRRGDLEAAEALFARAHAVDPTTRSLRAVVEARIALGRFDEVLPELIAAQRREPSGGWARGRLLDLLWECRIQVDAGPGLAWVELAEAQVEAKRGQARSLARLAAAHAAEGDYARAADVLRRIESAVAEGGGPTPGSPWSRRREAYERGERFCEAPGPSR